MIITEGRVTFQMGGRVWPIMSEIELPPPCYREMPPSLYVRLCRALRAGEVIMCVACFDEDDVAGALLDVVNGVITCPQRHEWHAQLPYPWGPVERELQYRAPWYVDGWPIRRVLDSRPA